MTRQLYVIAGWRTSSTVSHSMTDVSLQTIILYGYPLASRASASFFHDLDHQPHHASTFSTMTRITHSLHHLGYSISSIKNRCQQLPSLDHISAQWRAEASNICSSRYSLVSTIRLLLIPTCLSLSSTYTSLK